MGLDVEYLDLLKQVLERVAENGTASEEIRGLLVQHTLRHVQPRLEYYVDTLRRSFKSTPLVIGGSSDLETENALSARSVTQIRVLRTRRWIDNHKLEYQIVGRLECDPAQLSKSVHSGETYERLDELGAALFDRFREFCQLDPAAGTLHIQDFWKRLMSSK
jgi:hypothetical protein